MVSASDKMFELYQRSYFHSFCPGTGLGERTRDLLRKRKKVAVMITRRVRAVVYIIYMLSLDAAHHDVLMLQGHDCVIASASNLHLMI